MTRDTILVIVGPTASGKSETAVFLSQKLNGEIISVDSVQVYRGFDIGSAKPSEKILELVQHHMIDVTEPGSDFSLGDFVRMAEKSISAIWARGHLPILAGGTGLYFRGLLKGIVNAPKRNEEYRKALNNLAEKKGVPFLHALLAEADHEMAEKISKNDLQRITRALELFHTTRKTMSELIRENGFGEDRYRSIKIGVNTKREMLYKKIDARVDQFFKNGLIDEVISLLDSGVDPGCNAFKAVGYREVLLYLNGEIDRDMMIFLAKRNTRRYAKRQMTWFRKEEGIRWFEYSNDVSEAFEEICSYIVRGIQS